MAKIIKLKPTSAGRRFTVRISRNGIYKGRPLKSLVKKSTKASGRNNQGRITVRHRGGGAKKLIRQVDFKRDKIGIPGRVERIEHDPHRRAYLALVVYADGERRYILAPQGLKVGDTVASGEEAQIKPGNCLPLYRIPLGTIIHGIQLRPGKKAQLVRGAGVGATLLSKEEDYVTVRLPSTEVRKVNIECYAGIGALSNPENDLIVLGKAGASRWRGIRPTVRGVAMNPVDHPLGGGEGKSSGGRHPVSFTGKKEKATRNNKRTDKVIITRRKKRNK